MEQMELMPEKKKTKIVRRVLTIGEQFRLMEYVRENYAAARKLDADFAETASEALQIAGITTSHIATCREAFGLVSFRTILATERAAACATREVQTPATSAQIVALEARLESTERQIRRLFAEVERLQGEKND